MILWFELCAKVPKLSYYYYYYYYYACFYVTSMLPSLIHL
jgi:hypothetical protein